MSLFLTLKLLHLSVGLLVSYKSFNMLGTTFIGALSFFILNCKTTFFKIIKGILEPDSGKVVLENNSRVEWLPQVIDDDIISTEMTVFDFLLSGRPIETLNCELQKNYN